MLLLSTIWGDRSGSKRGELGEAKVQKDLRISPDRGDIYSQTVINGGGDEYLSSGSSFFSAGHLCSGGRERKGI